MSTYDRLKKLLMAHLGVDEARVHPDAAIVDDLGADSLDCVELIMAVEEEFGIEIPDADAEKIVTIADIDRYVTSLADTHR